MDQFGHNAHQIIVDYISYRMVSLNRSITKGNPNADHVNVTVLVCIVLRGDEKSFAGYSVEYFLTLYVTKSFLLITLKIPYDTSFCAYLTGMNCLKGTNT